MTLWRVDSVAAEKTGAIGYVDHLDWHATGGVTYLMLEVDEESGEDWIVVSRSDEAGADAEGILTGPQRPLPTGFVE
jgi:hypothetical protein